MRGPHDFFDSSIRASAENAEILLGNADHLRFETPPSTCFFLAKISQEESAKCFLLYLAQIGAVPWNKFIRRAIKSHISKQLVGIIIDYLEPDIDVFLAQMNERITSDYGWNIPKKVRDAMNILRHEQVRRWESNLWEWVEEPDYDREAKRTLKGRLDTLKQNALYVNIGSKGQVISTPSFVTKEDADLELDKATRYFRLAERVSKEPVNLPSDYKMIEELMRLLFNK